MLKVLGKPNRTVRFYARSASDKTDDWQFWFVADDTRGGLNVTADVARKLDPEHPSTGAVFRAPWDAVILAMRANRELNSTKSS